MRLIASVPGYHTASNLKKWGHMKLRNVLESCVFDKEFCKSPLVYQVTIIFLSSFSLMYFVKCLFKD